MNKYKCKGCKWYNKPFWSIINPCENCPREETNVEIITRWVDPTIEEKDKEIERLNKELEYYKKEKERLGKLFYNRNEENIRLNNIIKELQHKKTLNKKEYMKEYRKNNREKIKEYYKQWRKDNPDKVKEQSKRHYQRVKSKKILVEKVEE